MNTAPILITGMPRSGTSLIANMLGACGAFLGRTVGPAPENPRGFFENAAIREGIVKAQLVALRADPLGVQVLPEPEDTLALEPFAETLAEALTREGWSGGPWAYKDAKLTLLWPLWRREFPNARWVVVRRKKGEVVRSCLQTNFMRQHSSNSAFWMEFHDAYFRRMVALAESGAWHREVEPQKIFDGDWSEFEALVADLGLAFNKEACEACIQRSAWHARTDGVEPLYTKIRLNTEHDKVLDNIRSAFDRRTASMAAYSNKWPHRTGCVVGGGPSLKRHLKNLRRKQEAGAFVMATNNTHDYLIERGIVPDGLAIMDGRPGNAAFVQKPRDDVLYFIASQCDPSVFDALAGRNIVLWHASQNIGEAAVVGERIAGEPIIIGGSTVGLRAMVLELFMGMRDLHLYGMDSCYSGKQHHAYRQTLNDGEKMMAGDVFVGAGEFKRRFVCSAWQARQGEDFIGLMASRGHLFNTTVHGGGLIAALVDEMARRQQAA